MPTRDWQAEVALQRRRDRLSRAILGVDETADEAQIRRAFRRASLAHHPDANPADDQAARRFHLLRCAYEFLTAGRTCAALDALAADMNDEPETTNRRDNPWRYWHWWKEVFFDHGR